MKEGDLVRIVRQPPNQIAGIQGLVCVIEEIVDKRASVIALKPDGSTGGGGGVPLDCLEPETGPTWHKALQLREEKLAQLLKEAEARGKHWKRVVRKLAEANEISEDQVEHIYAELSKLRYGA